MRSGHRGTAIRFNFHRAFYFFRTSETAAAYVTRDTVTLVRFDRIPNARRKLRELAHVSWRDKIWLVKQLPNFVEKSSNLTLTKNGNLKIFLHGLATLFRGPCLQFLSVIFERARSPGGVFGIGADYGSPIIKKRRKKTSKGTLTYDHL